MTDEAKIKTTGDLLDAAMSLCTHHGLDMPIVVDRNEMNKRSKFGFMTEGINLSVKLVTSTDLREVEKVVIG